jgi:hypothetical protein
MKLAVAVLQYLIIRMKVSMETKIVTGRGNIRKSAYCHASINL